MLRLAMLLFIREPLDSLMLNLLMLDTLTLREQESDSIELRPINLFTHSRQDFKSTMKTIKHFLISDLSLKIVHSTEDLDLQLMLSLLMLTMDYTFGVILSLELLRLVFKSLTLTIFGSTRIGLLE